MSDEALDLGPWVFLNWQPVLKSYTLTLHLEPVPDQSAVRVVVEAHRDAEEPAPVGRYFRVMEEQPYDAVLARDGGTALYAVRNRLVDQLAQVITDYDARATPPPT